MTPVCRSARTFEVPPGVSENRRVLGDAGAWRDEGVEFGFAEPLLTLESIGVTGGGV